jgi:hypothetical protein
MEPWEHKRVYFPLPVPFTLPNSSKYLGPIDTKNPRNSLELNTNVDYFVRFKDFTEQTLKITVS